MLTNEEYKKFDDFLKSLNQGYTLNYLHGLFCALNLVSSRLFIRLPEIRGPHEGFKSLEEKEEVMALQKNLYLKINDDISNSNFKPLLYNGSTDSLQFEQIIEWC